MKVTVSSNDIVNTTFFFENVDIKDIESINFIEYLIDFNSKRFKNSKFTTTEMIEISNQLNNLFSDIRQDLLIWNIKTFDFYLTFCFNQMYFIIKNGYPILGRYNDVNMMINYKNINNILLANFLDCETAENKYLSPIDNKIYFNTYKILKSLSLILNVDFCNNLWLGKEKKLSIKNYSLSTSDKKPEFELIHEKFKFSFETFQDSIILLLFDEIKNERKRVFTLPIDYVSSFTLEELSNFLNIFFEAHYKENIGVGNLSRFIELKEMKDI